MLTHHVSCFIHAWVMLTQHVSWGQYGCMCILTKACHASCCVGHESCCLGHESCCVGHESCCLGHESCCVSHGSFDSPHTTYLMRFCGDFATRFFPIMRFCEDFATRFFPISILLFSIFYFFIHASFFNCHSTFLVFWWWVLVCNLSCFT